MPTPEGDITTTEILAPAESIIEEAIKEADAEEATEEYFEE